MRSPNIVSLVPIHNSAITRQYTVLSSLNISPFNHSKFTLCRPYNYYCIHWVQHKLETASTQDRQSAAPSQSLIPHHSSLGICRWTFLSTFPLFPVKYWIEWQLQSHLPIHRLQISYLQIDHLQVLLKIHSILVVYWSPNSLNPAHQVHTIKSFKCISKFAQKIPSKCIFKSCTIMALRFRW